MHSMNLYLMTFAPGALLLLFFVLWRRRLARLEKPGAMLRTASLDAGEIGAGGWWMGMSSTLLPLAGTATLLGVRWHSLPERFPIHWGMGGQPDGWATRSVGSIFGPLLVSVALTAGFGVIGELIARSSPGHEGRSVMIRTMRTTLVACCWFLAILMCSISLLPLAHDPTNLIPLITMGAVGFGLGIAGYVAFRAVRMEGVVIASQNSTDGRYWKAGLFYFNRSDSALMVPKRNGFGYTLNFGRPVCWLILGALLSIPLVFPLVLLVSGRH